MPSPHSLSSPIRRGYSLLFFNHTLSIFAEFRVDVNLLFPAHLWMESSIKIFFVLYRQLIYSETTLFRYIFAFASLAPFLIKKG